MKLSPWIFCISTSICRSATSACLLCSADSTLPRWTRICHFRPWIFSSGRQLQVQFKGICIELFAVLSLQWVLYWLLWVQIDSNLVLWFPLELLEDFNPFIETFSNQEHFIYHFISAHHSSIQYHITILLDLRWFARNLHTNSCSEVRY